MQQKKRDRRETGKELATHVLYKSSDDIEFVIDNLPRYRGNDVNQLLRRALNWNDVVAIARRFIRGELTGTWNGYSFSTLDIPTDSNSFYELLVLLNDVGFVTTGSQPYLPYFSSWSLVHKQELDDQHIWFIDVARVNGDSFLHNRIGRPYVTGFTKKHYAECMIQNDNSRVLNWLISYPQQNGQTKRDLYLLRRQGVPENDFQVDESRIDEFTLTKEVFMTVDDRLTESGSYRLARDVKIAEFGPTTNKYDGLDFKEELFVLIPSSRMEIFPIFKTLWDDLNGGEICYVDVWSRWNNIDNERFADAIRNAIVECV